MKRLILFITVVLAGAFFFTTQPPHVAYSATQDTVVAPAADIVLDTPDLIQSVERMNKKAELLNLKTERIKSNSRALEHDSKILRDIVADSLPKSDTLTETSHTIDTTTIEPTKLTLWRRIIGIFSKSK